MGAITYFCPKLNNVFKVVIYTCNNEPEAHFAIDFSITIQFWWKCQIWSCQTLDGEVATALCTWHDSSDVMAYEKLLRFDEIYIKLEPCVINSWGWVTHICVGNIIGSDNGLSLDRRQAITWINAGILLIGPLGTNFNEIVIEMYTFSFKKVHLKISCGKWWSFCLDLNLLNHQPNGPRRPSH